MEEQSQLLRLLLLQSERVSDQIDTINERLLDQNNTLIRLTCTVEKHEQRSTNMEKVQAACRETCDADILATQELAEEVQKALDKIKLYFRVIFWIFTVIAGTVGVIAGVAQIKSVWF